MKKYEILDMTSGPFVKKILRIAVPLMLTGALQYIYNAADVMVVGRYAGKECLAAVGSTGVLITLTLNMFMGLSAGAGVVTAHSIGAGKRQRTADCVHTSAALCIISGILVAVTGWFITDFLLEIMSTPEDVFSLASLYMKIIFLGTPAQIIYNFFSSILRSAGDTKRPLYILTVSGIINVILNLFFVIKLGMDVDGVATATIISQYLSAFAVTFILMKEENECRLVPSEIRINGEVLRDILKIGVPAGLQGSLFSVSNALIQSTVNSFGSVAMASNTAAQNIESLDYICTNSVSQTAMTFASQNMGAKKYENLRKIFFICMCISLFSNLLFCIPVFFIPEELMGIFSTDPEVISMGISRLFIMVYPYFIFSFVDITGFSIRGMGKSVEAMLITLIGIVGVRIFWIYVMFPIRPVLENIYISYPVSWLITGVILSVSFFIHERKLIKKRA